MKVVMKEDLDGGVEGLGSFFEALLEVLNCRNSTPANVT